MSAILFTILVKFTELKRKKSIFPETVSVVPVKTKGYSDQCKLGRGEGREKMPEMTRENSLLGPKSSLRETTPSSYSNGNAQRKSSLYIHTPKKANKKCSTNGALH